MNFADFAAIALGLIVIIGVLALVAVAAARHYLDSLIRRADAEIASRLAALEDEAATQRHRQDAHMYWHTVLYTNPLPDEFEGVSANAEVDAEAQ